MITASVSKRQHKISHFLCVNNKRLMAELSIIQNKLNAFVCFANTAIDIKLVRKTDDLEDDKTTFHPEMSHQFFGDKESIFGFKDLKIQLYYSAARLTTYLSMTYSEKISPLKVEGVQADEVLSVIAEKLPTGFLTNMSDFVSALQKEHGFRPFGEKLHEFSNKHGESEKCYEIFQTNVSAPGYCDYHQRLQTFVLWYIDAASPIDTDDEKWHIYSLYEKYTTDGKVMYALVGYTTVYHYYAYPNKTRPRISQMLVLPPYQNQRLGGKLLQAIYSVYAKDPDVLDITVEDPSDNFTRLRDYVDATNCHQLPSFSVDKLMQGFSDEMAAEAQSVLKINKRQARRIYEILRLKHTNLNNNEAYRAYRLDVKQRLNIPFQKQRADMEKLRKSLRPDEYRAMVQLEGLNQRLERLEHQYEELEVCYQHTLERMSSP